MAARFSAPTQRLLQRIVPVVKVDDALHRGGTHDYGRNLMNGMSSERHKMHCHHGTDELDVSVPAAAADTFPCLPHHGTPHTGIAHSINMTSSPYDPSY